MPTAEKRLYRIGSGILDMFRQDHNSRRYRSRLWYLLPVIFNLPGGIVSFFAIRYDDMDKAKNCLLLGIILFVPFLLLGAAVVAVGDAVGSVSSDICAELAMEEFASSTDEAVMFAAMFCD